MISSTKLTITGANLRTAEVGYRRVVPVEREREMIGGGKSPRRRQGREAMERAIADCAWRRERERERERERAKWVASKNIYII